MAWQGGASMTAYEFWEMEERLKRQSRIAYDHEVLSLTHADIASQVRLSTARVRQIYIQSRKSKARGLI